MREEKMKKTILIILGILLVAGIVGGGIYIWQMKIKGSKMTTKTDTSNPLSKNETNIYYETIFREDGRGPDHYIFYSMNNINDNNKKKLFEISTEETGALNINNIKFCAQNQKIYIQSNMGGALKEPPYSREVIKEMDLNGSIHDLNFTATDSNTQYKGWEYDYEGFAISADCNKIVWSIKYNKIDNYTETNSINEVTASNIDGSNKNLIFSANKQSGNQSPYPKLVTGWSVSDPNYVFVYDQSWTNNYYDIPRSDYKININNHELSKISTPNSSEYIQDSIKGIETYTNEKYGYKLNYLNNVMLVVPGYISPPADSKSDDISFAEIGQNAPEILNLYILQNKNNLDLDQFINNIAKDYSKKENITIDSQKSEKLYFTKGTIDTTSYGLSGVSMLAENEEFIFIGKDQNVFMFEIRNTIDKTLASQIVNSFQFHGTEPSDWTTYENKESGFGFKYPSNMTIKEYGGSQGELQIDGKKIIGFNSWLCEAENASSDKSSFEISAEKCYLSSIMGFQKILTSSKEYINNDKNNIYSAFSLNVLSGPLGHEQSVWNTNRVDFLLNEQDIYGRKNYNIFFLDLELNNDSYKEVLKQIALSLYKI